MSLLLALGIHPRVVMEIVGHSAMEMTMNGHGHGHGHGHGTATCNAPFRPELVAARLLVASCEVKRPYHDCRRCV